jgi:hypothetical protein
MAIVSQLKITASTETTMAREICTVLSSRAYLECPRREAQLLAVRVDVPHGGRP